MGQVAGTVALAREEFRNDTAVGTALTVPLHPVLRGWKGSVSEISKSRNTLDLALTKKDLAVP